MYDGEKKNRGLSKHTAQYAVYLIIVKEALNKKKINKLLFLLILLFLPKAHDCCSIINFFLDFSDSRT